MSSYNKSKINEDYSKDFHFIIFTNDKAELLKEIQKQINNINYETL